MSCRWREDLISCPLLSQTHCGEGALLQKHAAVCSYQSRLGTGDLGSMGCPLFSACLPPPSASGAEPKLPAPGLPLPQEEPSSILTSSEAGAGTHSQSLARARDAGVCRQGTAGLFFMWISATGLVLPVRCSRGLARQHRSAVAQTPPWLCPQPLGHLPPQLCLSQPEIPIRKRAARAVTESGMCDTLLSPRVWVIPRFALSNSLMLHPPPRAVPFNQPLSHFLVKSFASFSLQEPEPFFCYTLIDQAFASRLAAASRYFISSPHTAGCWAEPPRSSSSKQLQKCTRLRKEGRGKIDPAFDFMPPARNPVSERGSSQR